MMLTMLWRFFLGPFKLTAWGLLRSASMAALALCCSVSGGWFIEMLGLDDADLEFSSPDPSGMLQLQTWTVNMTVKSISSLICTCLCVLHKCAFHAYGTDQMCYLFGIGQDKTSTYKIEKITYLVTNAALGSDVTHSDLHSVWSLPASSAVDGDRSVGLYHSDSDAAGVPPPWIMVDLGEPCAVFKIRVYTRTDMCVDNRFIQMAVMLSEEPPTDEGDFSSFTTAYTFEGPPPFAGAIMDAPITPVQTARYVAMERQAPAGPEAILEFHEFEVHARKKVQ